MIAWAEARHISRSTLGRLGVESATRYFAEANSSCEVVVFPYFRGRDRINAKYRAVDGKMFSQEKDPELRFWGLDAALATPLASVIIVEGEMDRAAFVESGFDPGDVLSVPNGAPSRSSEKPDEQDRYRYVDAALKEGLNRTKRFVLATDNDPSGMALRQDLVRLLGAARCWFVDWPADIKDANDFLIKHGPEALRHYIDDGAKVWPVEGLYRLSDLPETEPLETWRPGFVEWENRIAFAAKTVSVVTGWPGHGKTALMQQIWFQICRDYGLVAGVASFETRPKPHGRKALRQFMYGTPQAELTDDQINHADRWIDDHFLWIVHPNKRPSLRWLLERAEVAIVRHNARIIQIDPWNKLESERPRDMNETDWIGACLDECLDFANDMNVHLQILAHPAKPGAPEQRGRAPHLSQIAGSQHWDNKIDQGMAVYRPKLFENGKRCTEAQLIMQKVRFEECGYPFTFHLDYDLSSRRYVPIDYASRMDRAMAS